MILDTLTSFDGFPLSLAFFPRENPKALVQIIHGSLEHKERYYDFIQFLNDHGYAVVVVDNRGHGGSVNQEYPLGYMKSMDEILKDQYEVTKWIKAKYPNKPLYLLGHSLGSIWARDYLQEHDNEIEKLAMTGMANYQPTAKFTGALAWIAGLVHGGKYGKAPFLNKLAGMNLPKEKWISYDQENLRSTDNDLLMPDMFLIGGFKVLGESDANLAKVKKFRCQNPDLWILAANGVDDPITGGVKGIKSSIDLLMKEGYTHIKALTYPHMMHEVLNETDKKTVYQDILAFFDEEK